MAFLRSDIMENDNMRSGVIPLNGITQNVNDRLADAFRTLGFVPPSPVALDPWDGEHVEEALCAYAYAVARATAEVESGTGTVVKVFTSGTVVQVFLLAHNVLPDSWSGSGPDNIQR